VYGQPSDSVRDPIDVPPQTRVTVTATSNVAPFAPVKGAVPEDANITAGRTNDPTPTVTLTLSAPLGKGETLEVYRNGKRIDVGLKECSATCRQFADNSGVSIPEPDSAPNRQLPIANTYSAAVVDAGGNRGPQGSLKADFDYFDCDQLRAEAATAKHKAWLVSSAADPKGSCAECHTTAPATKVGQATDRGVFVAVGSISANSAYWCRRP
jgi:hypothetical protein